MPCVRLLQTAECKRAPSKGSFVCLKLAPIFHKLFYRSARLHTQQLNRSARQGQQCHTKQDYLYNNGWKDPSETLHSQPWVKAAMKTFHTKQKVWQNKLCSICHELWPTRTSLSEQPYVCTRCKRDKKDPKLYSADNDMHPGNVPQCLQNLSQVEEMLISRACPIMTIYRKHGGQRGYKGHVVNLPQNIQGFLDSLPSNVSELPVLVVRKQGNNDTYADFRVRRERVLAAIQWLKQHNPCYSNITINLTNLQCLPQDGIPEGLLEVNTSDTPDEGDELDDDSHSFLPFPIAQQTEDLAISSTIRGEPLSWPGLHQNAINEFSTPYLATMCFPVLFPYGSGDPTNPARARNVSLTEALKHLNRFGEFINGKPAWRFASHPRFTYWGLNMKQRHQLLSQTSVYLQQHPGDANLTIDDLRSMVDTLPAQQLMSRLQRYASKIQGSSQYWYQRYQELKALLEQKGPPTFFWTVSSADNHWPDLHKLLPHSTSSPSRAVRRQAVINCPHITDWYFTSKLQDFVQHWLYNTLDADWHWYRLEYQARGSTHAHGCAKLKNDPGICSLMQKAALAWLVEQDINTQGIEPTEQQQKIIQEGNESKAEVILYADWLVTTCNESIPDNQWSFPDPHPCSVQYEDVNDMDQDYHDLVNSVERHAHCSPAYCLKRRVGQPVIKCRLNYPRPLLSNSTLTFEKLTDGSVRGILTSKRNDPRVNSHNRVMLQNWRANVDIQVIVDVQACARYMAKYAAKGEPRSKDVQSLFRFCTENTSNNSSGHQVLRRAMLRSVGERDYSAQETGHMLLSLPLSSCTYNFCSVSLTNSHKISKYQESGEITIHPSHLQQYSSRDPSLAQVNLKDFFSKYTVNGNDVKLRSQSVIVRTFPSYSYNPQGENYSQYCRFPLLKYHPWSNSTSYKWQTGDATEQENVDSYKEFLRTPKGKASIPTFMEELGRAQQFLHQNDPSSDDEVEDDSHHEEQEDWMVLCHLHQDLSTASNQPSDVDWAYYCRTLPTATVTEAAKWIRTTKTNMHDQGLNIQRRTVDITTLNTEQSIAYSIVQHHHNSLSLNQQPPPLRMIICGTAGTGKSYLISAIVQCLTNKVIVTATTGMAAFNICGETVHSVLQLPIRSTNKKELQGSSLQRLQMKLKHKHYLLIDEMSMLGQTTFAWIDKRLRQAIYWQT